MVSLGSFRELTRRTKNRISEGFPGVDELEVRIIAYYGAQRGPFGAVRTFRICGDERESFVLGHHFTRHLYSGSDAEQVTEWLKERMNTARVKVYDAMRYGDDRCAQAADLLGMALAGGA